MDHLPAPDRPMGAAGRSVTLDDVARAAGVAASTVSRALSNPGRVNPATRERVRAVAEHLGYRPYRVALPVAPGRTLLLALLVPDITNPINFGLVRGAEAQARAAGYTLVLGDTQESPDFEKANVDRLGPSVDGFLLASSRLSDADLHELAQRQVIALFNREAPGLPSVITDSVDGGRQIMEHLAALGHRRVVYLAGPSTSWSGAQRWGSLSATASAIGVELLRRGPFSPTLDNGPAAADIGLASGATALVAFNDLLAIGMLGRLGRRGIDVPGQVSVVGYDDIFGADFCHPSLTTVAIPAEQAGRALIDVLLGSRTSADPPRAVLPTQLCVRDSTGPVPAGAVPAP